MGHAGMVQRRLLFAGQHQLHHEVPRGAQQAFIFDYVGGWNETVANPSTPAIRQWFINLKSALIANHPNTKLVAYDDGGTNWRIGDDMVTYPDFGAAIDVLGQHSPGVWRSL